MSPLPPAGPSVPNDSAPPGGALPGAPVTGARPAIQQAAERLAAGRPAEAAEALGRLVSEAPTYAAAHVLHAVALEAAGEPERALASWHRAAFLVPQSPLVVRERARLLAALPPAAPAPEAVDLVHEVDDLTFETPDVESLETQSPITEADEPAHDAPPEVSWETFVSSDADVETPTLGDDPLEDDPFDDLPPLQTLPLDDLTGSFAPDAEDDPDDAFDPDGFDFSAFDLGDDDTGWLTGQSGDTAPSGVAEPDASEPAPSAWDADALPDWSDAADEPVTLMPPEVPDEPADEAAAETNAGPESVTWAVFEDEPAVAAEPFNGSAFGVAPLVPEPEAPEPPEPASTVADELDSLIASLEQAPRIRPDPTFSGPAVTSADADVDAMASETLAKIYAAQHQYAQAALVYETIAAREPARAEAMLAQAAAMRQRRA